MYEPFGAADIEVCLLGVGIVFTGLLCIVVLSYVMSLFCRLFTSRQTAASQEPVSVASEQTQEIPNRQEFVAAVSAALAEEMGKDISAIRILSIKKV